MKKSVSIYFYGVSEDGSTIRWKSSSVDFHIGPCLYWEESV